MIDIENYDENNIFAKILKKEIINFMLDFQQNKEFINTLFLIK